MTRDIEKGGINDPVAQSIRNEMNRDAAPTPEEAARKARNDLRERGCDHPDCDVTDPDKLARKQRYYPNCHGVQVPRLPDVTVIVCVDHHDYPRDKWQYRANTERGLYVGRGINDAQSEVAWYECGNYKTPRTIDSMHITTPMIPARCPKCGAEIDYVSYL